MPCHPSRCHKAFWKLCVAWTVWLLFACVVWRVLISKAALHSFSCWLLSHRWQDNKGNSESKAHMSICSACLPKQIRFEPLVDYGRCWRSAIPQKRHAQQAHTHRMLRCSHRNNTAESKGPTVLTQHLNMPFELSLVHNPHCNCIHGNPNNDIQSDRAFALFHGQGHKITASYPMNLPLIRSKTKNDPRSPGSQ